MGRSQFFDNGLVMLSGYVAGSLIALGFAILVGAIMLRIASWVLRFPRIRFEHAMYATGVAAVTLFSIQFSIISNYIGVAAQVLRNGPYGAAPMSAMGLMFNPTYMTFGITVGVLLAALLYQRLLNFEDEEVFEDDDEATAKPPFSLSFGDAVCLAAVQIGLSMLTCLILGFCLFMAFAILTSF